MQEKYLSVTQYAQSQGLTSGRIHQLIAAGKLEAERVGGVFLIRKGAEIRRTKAGRPSVQDGAGEPESADVGLPAADEQTL